MTTTVDPVVVDSLSKSYTIGRIVEGAMLRETLSSIVRNPFRQRSEKLETFWALRDVSFRVGQGEVVGIIGRNGAGKSTLLKVLSRITFPTSGTVKVTGRVASLLEVGTGFHEELTGRENIFLNGSILGMRKQEVASKLDAIIDFAGVDKFIDTPIKRFSSGMRLRLGFAVAAHLDPDILIVDEVLAVGDAGFQKKCLSAMEDLHRGGRTVLFVSHNMAAVENLCSRGIWIDEGAVRMDGGAHDVIKSYMTTFGGSEAQALDFTTIEQRRGTGEIRYTRMEYLTADGHPLSVLRSGDPVTLRMHYRATAQVRRPSFGIRLTTDMGTLVTETSTWHHGIDIPLVQQGSGWIDLEIRLLNLVPARYYLSLWLTGDGQAVFDGLEFCSQLDVDASNVYKSSRVIDSRYGVVYFPQTWNLDGLSQDESSTEGR